MNNRLQDTYDADDWFFDDFSFSDRHTRPPPSSVHPSRSRSRHVRGPEDATAPTRPAQSLERSRLSSSGGPRTSRSSAGRFGNHQAMPAFSEPPRQPRLSAIPRTSVFSAMALGLDEISGGSLKHSIPDYEGPSRASGRLKRRKPRDLPPIRMVRAVPSDTPISVISEERPGEVICLGRTGSISHYICNGQEKPPVCHLMVTGGNADNESALEFLDGYDYIDLPEREDIEFEASALDQLALRLSQAFFGYQNPARADIYGEVLEYPLKIYLGTCLDSRWAPDQPEPDDEHANEPAKQLAHPDVTTEPDDEVSLETNSQIPGAPEKVLDPSVTEELTEQSVSVSCDGAKTTASSISTDKTERADNCSKKKSRKEPNYMKAARVRKTMKDKRKHGLRPARRGKRVDFC